MKRQYLMVLFLTFVTCTSFADDVELDVTQCGIVQGFYDLWEKSFFGREPNREETSAWVQGNPLHQEFQFIFWEITPERGKNTWRGPRPENVVAIVHTHPQKMDPRPSAIDADVARELNMPIYTISRKGVWKVSPAGVIVQKADRHWHKVLNTCKLAQSR